LKEKPKNYGNRGSIMLAYEDEDGVRRAEISIDADGITNRTARGMAAWLHYFAAWADEGTPSEPKYRRTDDRETEV
jgi:hypothetical protein